MLGHDILKKFIEDNRLDSQAIKQLREEIKTSITHKWLRQIILCEDEAELLCKEEAGDEEKNRRTVSIPDFQHSWFNYLKKGETVYDKTRDDELAIIAADGKKVYIAKWWGDPTIPKLVSVLKDKGWDANLKVY